MDTLLPKERDLAKAPQEAYQVACDAALAAGLSRPKKPRAPQAPPAAARPDTHSGYAGNPVEASAVRSGRKTESGTDSGPF